MPYYCQTVQMIRDALSPAEPWCVKHQRWYSECQGRVDTQAGPRGEPIFYRDREAPLKLPIRGKDGY